LPAFTGAKDAASFAVRRLARVFSLYLYNNGVKILQMFITFQCGKDALHIGGLKFGNSALTWVILISLPVVDLVTNRPVGAVTIGLDPSAPVDTSLR
jgi:hypothetical protein